MGRGIGTRLVAGGHSVTFVDANPETAEKTAAELGVDVTPRFKVLKVSEPPKRTAGAKVASVSELLDKLKADGVL